jgi:arginase
MEEVHGIGIKEAVKYALSRIDPRNQRHIHVSFDIDALDPLEAPSTGTPGRINIK